MLKLMKFPGIKSFQRSAEQLSGFLRKSFGGVVEELTTAREKMKDLVSTNYDLGVYHLQQGNLTDATFRFQMLLRFNPGYVPGIYQLGRCHYLSGNNDKAQECFQKVLAVEPNHQEAIYMMALVQGRGDINEIPLGVVRDYFNQVASEYDTEYVSNQEYTGHEKCFETAKRILETGGKKKVSIIDLGCGTGLCAALFRESDMAVRVKGVDVSSQMLDLARNRKVHDRVVYNFLKEGDILTYLKEEEGIFELVVAAGALDYVGDLAEIFKYVAQHLEPEGLWIFTVQKGEGATYKILPTLESFSHSAAYVENVAEQAQLELVSKEEFMLYKERSALVYAYKKK